MFVAVANTPQNVIKGPVVVVPQVAQVATTSATTTDIDITNATSSQDIAEIVQDYYKDTPILANVARCESQYRQYNSNGSVFRGVVNNADVGVMQINEKYHSARAKQLGIDLHTLEGNLEYGALLYKEQGLQPWSASKPCWGSTVAKATVKTNSTVAVASSTTLALNN